MKKQVVKQIPKDYALVSKLTNKEYIGVMYPPTRDKGFVTSSKYEGELVVLCATGLTCGNGWNMQKFKGFRSAYDNEVAAFIEKVMGEFEVFAFDSQKELFTWLSE